MTCTKIEGASKRGVEDAAPYKGARLRFSVVGDGVPDVPNLAPQRVLDVVCSNIEGTSDGTLLGERIAASLRSSQ